MNILKSNQYNQGIGKYKLLSSNSGVGSIITTKVGSYVLISDINKWNFINWVNAKSEIIRSNNSDDRKVYNLCRVEISNRGLNVVDDRRFVRFIRDEKDFGSLICLVGIPHMALNESFNTPKWKNHPIRTALQNSGEQFEGVSGQYMINSTHFPKWFKNKKGELKKLSEWRQIWLSECHKQNGVLTIEHFAPPRDGNDFIRSFSSKNIDGTKIQVREYKRLEQTNLILICPNGHLSDIPWPNYLRWKTEKLIRQRPDEDKGENLLSNEMVGCCCGKPKLKWTESKTKSEGYGSIYIECLSCSLGSGVEKDKPKINLEGINSLKPYCVGQKPWELDIDNSGVIPFEPCYEESIAPRRENMRVALVTANNVYYANGFSSLFVPMYLAENKSIELIESIVILEKKYQKHFERTGISREEFWKSKFDLEDFLIDNDINVDNILIFNELLKSEFFNNCIDSNEIDNHEEYRWQEYRCFSNNSSLPDIDINKGIRFSDIIIPIEIKDLFKKIQQVEELKITNVQLDFTRVKPKERIVRLDQDGERVVQNATSGQNIFSIDSTELFVLPANETLGEGLFFEFNNEAIIRWINSNQVYFNERFSKYINIRIDDNSQGAGTKRKIQLNGIKHFLIHSFSHMMMRELEFSCGYPTASLKERLYISNTPEKTMSGVLIYTAEGSEGSMGGLVSQGEPNKILEIIKNGLERLINCSSDPLCWESEGQGIFDLNLSACFSCSLVSETACEEMNLGLDRRVLVDSEFGYFKIY